MSELYLHRHALEPFLESLPQEAIGSAGVTVHILPKAAHINLRGDPGNTRFVEAVNATLEQKLPLCTNTMTIGKHQIFSLGPDEWVLVTSIADTSSLVISIREALTGQHASVNDLSGGQIALRLTGPDVRKVLAKGCTLDFHPDEFKVGACAQSGLAKANILVGLLDNHSTFEIIVRRSFAEYLVLWLRQSASEYGVNFQLGS